MKFPSKDLKEMIDYLYEEEKKHYLEMKDELVPKAREKHIYNNIKRVKKWLAQQSK